MKLPRTDGMQRFWRLNASGTDEIGGNTLSVSDTVFEKTPRSYQTYCAVANGTSSSLASGNTVSGVRTLFFSIYPTANNRTFLTATGISITINSSSQIATSGLTGVSVSVNGQPTTSIVLNAWNFIAITHDSANYASVNVFASSYVGKAQTVGTFDRLISVDEIRDWLEESLRKLGGASLSGLLDGCVAKIDTLDGNELSDIVGGVAVTKVSGTAATDNLGGTRAVTNPNYTWPSITYTTGYAFENLGSGWVLTQSPSGLSATGINRTTTLREIFLFDRTLSTDEKNALETLCNATYVLPFGENGIGDRGSLPEELREGCVLFIPGAVIGSTSYDASGNGNHLSYANSPERKRRYGYKGHSFNGSSFLYRGDAAGVTDHYTFSCSVKMNAELGGGDVVFMHLGNTAGGNIFDSAIQYYLNAGTLYLRHFRNRSGVSFDYADVAYSIGTEKFSRIAITFDGSACRMYVNGTKVMDFASSGFGTNPSIGTQMSIARYFNGDTTFSRPNAQIFNPLIANRAFSDDEIRLDALTFFIP